MVDNNPSTAEGGAPPPPQLPQTNVNTPEPTGSPTSGRNLLDRLSTLCRNAGNLLSPPTREVTTSTPGSEPSAITATTTNTPAVAAAKRTINTDSDDESEQLSKKPKYADYTNKHSENDSVVSNDNELMWEEENHRVALAVADANDKEMEAANNMTDPVAESFDWEGFEADGQDGQVSATPTNEAQPAERPFTMKLYDLGDKKVTVNVLKDLLKVLDLPTTGNKTVLFQRVRNANSHFVEKINDDDKKFKFKHFDDEEARLPKWIILAGEALPPVEGIDMDTGAADGFYNPTNPDGLKIGRNRRNFLTRDGETIKRPEFAVKPKKKSNALSSSPPVPSIPPPPPPVDGGPSKLAKELIGDIRHARPSDIFYTQISEEFIDKQMTGSTNARAAAEGAANFIPFDPAEMKRFIAFFLANGITPRPQLEQWFDEKNWLLGNKTMIDLLTKKTRFGDISAAERLRQYRRYMCLYDFRETRSQEAKTNPLFKVQPLLDELNRQATKMWRTGKFVSIDEQTIGFKGKSSMKLRISYKREGDGFQCDALCDRGYTYAFYFRHGAPPKLDEHKDLNLSPTARRVVWLAKRLTNNWTRVYMDNLFNSMKLFQALYREKVLAHGIVRSNGRGFPTSIIQKKETDQKKAALSKGTTKAARLMNSKGCPDCLAVSLFDNAPINILSMCETKVEWITLQRMGVWNAEERQRQPMKFLRLNFVHAYNLFMNSVDLADQLRNAYRPDFNARQRKWWWSLYLWAIGVAATNAWKIYEVMYEEERKRLAAKKLKNDLPKKWTHAEFLMELVNDLMWPEKAKEVQKQSRAAAASSGSSARSNSTLRSGRSFSSTSSASTDLSSKEGVEKYLEQKKASQINESRMKSNFFATRLDGKQHVHIPAMLNSTHCQYCYYKWKRLDESEQQQNMKMKQNRDKVRRCLTCNVNLCWLCENEWHGVDMSAYQG